MKPNSSDSARLRDPLLVADDRLTCSPPYSKKVSFSPLHFQLVVLATLLLELVVHLLPKLDQLLVELLPLDPFITCLAVVANLELRQHIRRMLNHPCHHWMATAESYSYTVF